MTPEQRIEQLEKSVHRQTLANVACVGVGIGGLVVGGLAVALRGAPSSAAPASMTSAPTIAPVKSDGPSPVNMGKDGAVLVGSLGTCYIVQADGSSRPVMVGLGGEAFMMSTTK